MERFDYLYLKELDDISLALLFLTNYTYHLKNVRLKENILISGNADKFGKTSAEIKSNLNKALKEINKLEEDFTKLKINSIKEKLETKEKVKKWEEYFNKDVKS